MVTLISIVGVAFGVLALTVVLGVTGGFQGAFEERIKERPELVTTLDAMAGELGKTRAQVLLNWVLHEPNVITIPMTNRPERVDENCAASGWRLTDAQHAALADAAGAGRTRRWWT